MKEYDIEKIGDVTKYYKKGTKVLHRTDGPAHIYPDPNRKYWVKELQPEGEPTVSLNRYVEEYWLEGRQVEYKEFVFRTKGVYYV